MVVDELVQRVELDDPQEVLARLISEDLEVLHVDPSSVVHSTNVCSHSVSAIATGRGAWHSTGIYRYA